MRVLVIGGGIHGVGVLHDLASRGWKDIVLLEKETIGSGTSQKSTKLVHGGLRYLERITDFPLVSEALNERGLLLQLAPDLVKPIEMIFPILKNGGKPAFYVRAGLWLYDLLSGNKKIANHREISRDEVVVKAPIIETRIFSRYFSFWDAQMDDLGLCKRVAHSAQQLGGKIYESTQVRSLQPDQNGWIVEYQDASGQIKKISAQYVFNAAGPWSHELFIRSGIDPKMHAINNRGSHLVLADLGLKSALFLQSPSDNRIFFVIPWLEKTLIGTTESEHDGTADAVHATQEDIGYLLKRVNAFLKVPIKESQIEATFSGLRWLSIKKGRSLSRTSRSHELSVLKSGTGLLMTLYGGKYSTYRSLAVEAGDRITKHFGEFSPSQTHLPKYWVSPGDKNKTMLSVSNDMGMPPPLTRFNKFKA